MVFNSVADLTAALDGTAAISGDRIAVSGTPPRRAHRSAGAHRGVRRHARGEGHGAVGDHPSGRRPGRPLRLDSRPLPGDGPRRSRRLHGAGDQRAGDGLRHRPARHTRGQGPRRRRVHPRDRPLRDRLHRAAPARVRGDHGRGGAARGLPRPAVPAGRSRAGEPRNTPRPTATRSSRRCADSSARRSPPGSTTSTSTPRRWSTSTSRRWPSSRRSTASWPPTSPPSSAAASPQGVTVSVGGEIGEVGGKNSDVHELHAFMQGYNAALAPGARGSSASARSACRPARRTAGSSVPTARSGPT